MIIDTRLQQSRLLILVRRHNVILTCLCALIEAFSSVVVPENPRTYKVVNSYVIIQCSDCSWATSGQEPMPDETCYCFHVANETWRLLILLHFWCCYSVRGMIKGTENVQVSAERNHSFSLKLIPTIKYRINIQCEKRKCVYYTIKATRITDLRI